MAVSKATETEVTLEPTQEVDEIVETAKSIEGMTPDAAFNLIPKLLDNVDQSYFRLGGVLSIVQSNKWWEDQGFENFRAFVQGKFGIAYRKAMYLINIYNKLVDAGIKWDQVKSLGWSKLKELADILTKENVDEWVIKCQNLTVLQIQEEVKKATMGTLQASDTPEQDTSAQITTFTAKVFPDQKETIQQAIEKAKKEANTDSPGVALEAICISYLSGGKASSKKVPSLKELMEKSGDPEEILKVFEQVFPTVDLTVKL